MGWFGRRRKTDPPPPQSPPSVMVWNLTTEELERVANDVRMKVLSSLVECQAIDPEVADDWYDEHVCVLKRPTDISPQFHDKNKKALPSDPETFTFFVMRVTGMPASYMPDDSPEAPAPTTKPSRLSVVPLNKDNLTKLPSDADYKPKDEEPEKE